MKKYLGITLIEICISISVSVVLMFMGVNSLQKLFVNHQLNVRINEFQTIISYARLVSIQAGKPFCLRACDNKDWNQCVVLWQNEKRHRVWAWSDSNMRVTWQGLASTHELCFNGTLSKNVLNGHFLFKSRFDEKKLTLNRFGKIKIS